MAVHYAYEYRWCPKVSRTANRPEGLLFGELSEGFACDLHTGPSLIQLRSNRFIEPDSRAVFSKHQPADVAAACAVRDLSQPAEQTTGDAAPAKIRTDIQILNIDAASAGPGRVSPVIQG